MNSSYYLRICVAIEIASQLKMCQLSSQKPSIAILKREAPKEEGCKSMKIGRATQVTVRCKIEGKLGERKNNDATRMTGSNSS